VSEKTGYVKIKTDDWVNDVIRLIEGSGKCSYYITHRDAFLAAILPRYRPWAVGFYAGKEVPTPHDMADLFFNESEWLIRTEEDLFLMNEMKARTTAMTKDEWEAYCNEKEVIVFDDHYALITDGLCHVHEAKETPPTAPKLEDWDDIIRRIIQADSSAKDILQEVDFLQKSVFYSKDRRAVWCGFAGNVDKGFILIGDKIEWFEASSLEGLIETFRRFFDKEGWEPNGYEM